MNNKIIKGFSKALYIVAGIFLIWSVLSIIMQIVMLPAYISSMREDFSDYYIVQNVVYIVSNGLIYFVYAALLAATGFIIERRTLTDKMKKVFSVALNVSAVLALIYFIWNIACMVLEISGAVETMVLQYSSYNIVNRIRDILMIFIYAILAVLAYFKINGKVLTDKMKKVFSVTLYLITGFLLIYSVWVFIVVMKAISTGKADISNNTMAFIPNIIIFIRYSAFAMMLTMVGYKISEKTIVNDKIKKISRIILYIGAGLMFGWCIFYIIFSTSFILQTGASKLVLPIGSSKTIVSVLYVAVDWLLLFVYALLPVIVGLTICADREEIQPDGQTDEQNQITEEDTGAVIT